MSAMQMTVMQMTVMHKTVLDWCNATVVHIKIKPPFTLKFNKACTRQLHIPY